MGKKNVTKTAGQIEILEEYYTKSKSTKQSLLKDLYKIGQRIGLKRTQVYKWFWDKDNQQKKKTKQNADQSNRAEFDWAQETQDTIHPIIYNSFELQVPKNVRKAIQFQVNQSVSDWARNILRNEGWQFIKLSQSDQRNQQEISIEHQDDLSDMNEHSCCNDMNESLKNKMSSFGCRSSKNNQIEKKEEMEVQEEMEEMEDNNGESDLNQGRYFFEREAMAGFYLDSNNLVVENEPLFAEQQDLSEPILEQNLPERDTEQEPPVPLQEEDCFDIIDI